MQEYYSDLELGKRFGVSRMTLWRWCREKRFPQPVRLGLNCTRWPRAEVEQWERQRAAGGEHQGHARKRLNQHPPAEG